MKRLKGLVLFVCCVLIVAVFQSCHTHEHAHNEFEPPSVAVTQWTDKMELFMEYPIPVESEPGKFIIHLTTLDDFKPVTTGKVILRFKSKGGNTLQFEKGELLREGIFTPELALPDSGKYVFTLSYENEIIKETFNIGEVGVYKSYEDIPPQPEEDDSGITFLKEQQWKTEFRTAPAQIQEVRSSVSAVGEIIPRQQSYAEVVSPVEGILEVSQNQNMVTPGSRIEKGLIIATLSPPLDVANSWTDLKLAYQHARSEFERAKRLLEKDAISEREYEKLRQEYLARKAGYDEFFDSDPDRGNELFELKSPIGGIVNKVFVSPGQKVSPGQRLATIVDPTFVWLEVDVFEKDYYKIGNPQGASLSVPGIEYPIIVDESKLRLINEGQIIDPESRTIPLLFELKNPNRVFKIGQVLDIELYTSEEKESLCIPRQSIYEDEGKKVVFVHVGGETFEKREVETGGSYKGCVEIHQGLKKGERVVTEGGYQVKLASTSAEIGHRHSH